MSARKPFVAAISGIKNSGKTTFLEHLVPVLRARGLRVAVIKHDGHTFRPDDPATDTGRHFAAGACGTALFDGEKCRVVKRGCFDENDFIPLFPEADLILLEGFKGSCWPKLELVRAGNSEQPVCDPATLLALVTDLPVAPDGVPTIPFGDSRAAAELIVTHVKGGTSHD